MSKKLTQSENNLNDQIKWFKKWIWLFPFPSAICAIWILSLAELLYELIFRHEMKWGLVIPPPVYWVITTLVGIIAGCSGYIEYSALKKYLDVLEKKQLDEAVEYGREYYSIKRKSFLGLDGQGYNVDDDDAIAKDIEFYCRS